MNKIGIMGGTFNPIHNSHILLGIEAKNLFNLDKVLFMPTQNPPYKEIADNISNEDRCEMVRRAVAGTDGLEFCDYEFHREGKTYTSDTLISLCNENPDTRYYFIIGADSIGYFDKWHLPEVILRHSAIICAPRADMNRDVTFSEIERIRSLYTVSDEDGTVFRPEIYYMASPCMDISSTTIRAYITCGLSIKGLVPDAVNEYICSEGLYKSEKIAYIKENLKKLLSEKRYTHVLSVADFALKLALIHDCDPIKTYIAGLLHDCAKYLSDEEILSEMKRYGLKPDKAELALPNNLLHSKIGAYYAKEKYGIEDEEIISSISYHTTGRPGMGLLEKIIFLSDTLEYGRKMVYEPSLDIIRSIATTDLNKAVFYVMNNNVPYVIENFKDNVCQASIEAFEFYKKNYGD